MSDVTTRVDVAVAQWLAAQGVTDVFGVVGSGNFHVTNGLCAAGARFHPARHETGAACMADAYARTTGRLGVVTLHQGPGLTNALTGLIEATKSRTPLLALAGETPAAAVASNFRIDQPMVVGGAGVSVERVHTPRTALRDIARAHRLATHDRRTVVAMLPLDVARSPLPVDHLAPPPATSPPMPAPDESTLLAAAELVASAARPVVLAGRGAVLADAADVLTSLADRIGALVATTAVAHGFFHQDPYDIGIAGGYASPLAAELLRRADLVVAFGASLNRWTTRDGDLFAPDVRVVQVDSDPMALAAHRPVDVPVVGDVRITAAQLDTLLAKGGERATGWRTRQLDETLRRRRWRDVAYEDRSDGERVDPRTVTIALDDLLPLERTVTIDAGHFMGWPTMYLASPDGRGLVFNQAYMAVGVGLGSAVGAAVGRPDRVTVATVGDGGALMGLGELETMVRLGLPVLVVVYNDDAYGAEVHHFPDEPLDAVRFPPTDIAGVARALGAQATVVRRVGDLGVVEDWLGNPRGPLVLDVKVHGQVVGAWLEDAFRGE